MTLVPTDKSKDISRKHEELWNMYIYIIYIYI